MNQIRISGYIPGSIGRITELHATYYSEHWGFGLFFESKVATDMSAFLKRFDETRDGFWVASVDGVIVGSIAIDGIKADSEGAHLRWFIVAPGYEGEGIGNRLIREGIGFCKKKRFKRIYLWTFAGLDPARYLYEKYGFRICKEIDGNQWGVRVKEQMFELRL
ncbi:MAG: GNAT family N-acetyltransferase [Desulfobacterales bacterium]|nr:GNAT family N-acetyltransferase [Desulfobacterales bacterium]MBL7225287.1 GNAT family N-acetyltransferase [Desulfobacteraceae bacterium]